MPKPQLAILLAALITTGACAKKKEAEADPVVPVQAAPARLDSVERRIAAEAILFPKDQSAVMPKIGAPVKKFYVNRGDHVSQGQLVAVLENRDLAAAVTESKGGLDQAQAAYTTTTAATVPEDLNKAKQDLESARQALDAAQKLYQSRQQLFEQGALARRLVDEANVAFVQARSQFEVAQKHLQSLQGVGQQEQIKGAAAQVEAARGRYQGASAQLGYSEIRSPIAGIVADRPIFAGEMASAGTPLLTIMDISRVIARANVPVAQASFLKPGLPASVTQVDGTLEAQGKVTVVSPAVDPNSTTVEVWIEVPNPGERFKPGSTVRVSVLAETIQDALVIPQAALLPSQEGGTTAMVIGADSVAHERKLEAGVRDGDKVQVLKGLKAGDRVVTVGGVGLQDGAKVQVEQPGAKPAADKPEAPEKPE
jgi:HlyD family secretion protein